MRCRPPVTAWAGGLGVAAVFYVAVDYLRYLSPAWHSWLMPALWSVLALVAVARAPFYRHWSVEFRSVFPFVASMIFLLSTILFEALSVRSVSAVLGLDWHRKAFMQWWIGHTKLTLCSVYQCMGLQNGIFLVRKLMQQDLYASCLMIWSQDSRISMQFGRFVDEACHQIERNERNVRQMGVLSYIPRFATLATRMEQCIQGQSRDLVDQAYTKFQLEAFIDVGSPSLPVNFFGDLVFDWRAHHWDCQQLIYSSEEEPLATTIHAPPRTRTFHGLVPHAPTREGVWPISWFP